MNWFDRFLWPRAALADIAVDVAAIRLSLLGIPARLTKMEKLIMASAADLAARIAAATNELAADLTAIKASLAVALASGDAATQAAVDAALAQLDAPIARLEALGADEAPVEPTPAPEPAPVDSPDPQA